MSTPNGKWTSYYTDGSSMNPEGIYMSSTNPSLHSKHIKPCKIHDFTKNEEPVETFGMRMSEMLSGCGCCKP